MGIVERKKYAGYLIVACTEWFHHQYIGVVGWQHHPIASTQRDETAWLICACGHGDLLADATEYIRP